MSPYEQHQPPSHNRGRNHGRCNRRHGSQSLPHQYVSSNDFALEDTTFPQPNVQSHNTRSLQQSATLFDGDEYFQGNTIPEDDVSQMWPQQRGSTEKMWDHGEPVTITFHGASNYRLNVPGAPNIWQGHRSTPPEQFGALFPMMGDQFVHGRASTVAADTLPNSYVRTEHHLQTDASIGSQLLQGMGHADHDIVHHNPNFLSPAQLDLGVAMTPFNNNPQPEPWSAYHVAYADPMPSFVPVSDWHDTSGITPSTTDFDESGSGYINDINTPLSSMNYTNDPMVNSTMTQRAPPEYTQYVNSGQIPNSFATVPDSPPSPLFPIHTERSLTPMVTSSTSQGDLRRGSGGLAILMQRNSSIRSSTSRASSASAPPTHTPDVMYCSEGGCRQAFRGQYCRGNLARHRRLSHGKGKPYVCGDKTCAKEFKRQDARLKHYRKYHSELAASSPFVSRLTASRPTGREQEVDPSDMPRLAS